MDNFEFKPSDFGTVGVELELQILDPATLDMRNAAAQLLALTSAFPVDIKPEITQTMIEAASGVHRTDAGLRQDLRDLAKILIESADRAGLAIAGGGVHPFARWRNQKISPDDRYQKLEQRFGYLARKFTVFGMHVHVGCESGDQALHVLQSLNRYVPLLIALAASSPFQRATDTGFESSRLHTIDAFPSSGAAPSALKWEQFVEQYLVPMRSMGVAESMKDYYWDIRPKPEFGTVEIRVCDTPLTVDHAADIAALIRVLARYSLERDPQHFGSLQRATYCANRFEAARRGLHADYFDTESDSRTTVRRFGIETLMRTAGIARSMNLDAPCRRLLARLVAGTSDAANLRGAFLATRDAYGATQFAVRSFRELMNSGQPHHPDLERTRRKLSA